MRQYIVGWTFQPKGCRSHFIKECHVKPIDLSRRELMVAAGGIAITGLAWPVGALGQEPDPLGKDLIFRTTDPRNAEPELAKLVQSWITPVKHFYVRSHAPNPDIDVNQYTLTLEGRVRTPLTPDTEGPRSTAPSYRDGDADLCWKSAGRVQPGRKGGGCAMGGRRDRQRSLVRHRTGRCIETSGSSGRRQARLV